MKLGQFRTLEGAANASFFSWVKFHYKILFNLKWSHIADPFYNLLISLKEILMIIIWFAVVVLSPLILPILIPIKIRGAKKELAQEKEKESKEKPKNPYY